MTASNADNMWIETGGTSSVNRYQIDLKEELAEFFDEKTDGEARVNLEFSDSDFPGQQLRKKDEEHHFTPQWRLYLPTDFPEYDDDYYPHTVVKFEKKQKGGERWYELEVADVDSNTHNQWRNEADSSGTRDSTEAVDPSESREYGYY